MTSEDGPGPVNGIRILLVDASPAIAGLALAVAGGFAQQRRRAPTGGTLPTASWTFATMRVGVTATVGGLSYFVALCLGPVAEQLVGGA